MEWTDALQAEFSYLQSCLCANPCLVLPLPNDSFILQTDASGTGVGSVLTVSRDGSEHPVAYYSRKLSPAEKNYSVTELEALAVVASIQHFDVYLYGTTFMVVTNHRALSFLDSAKLLTGMISSLGSTAPDLPVQDSVQAWIQESDPGRSFEMFHRAPRLQQRSGGCCAMPQRRHLNTNHIRLSISHYHVSLISHFSLSVIHTFGPYLHTFLIRLYPFL